MQRKLLGIFNVDFDPTGELLIIYSAFVKLLRTNWKKTKQSISYLWTARKQLGWRSYITVLLNLVSP